MEETMAAATPDPVEQVVSRQVSKDALAKLDDDSRPMLLLTAEGFSYAEIASMMGFTGPAVRQRIYLARERLRALVSNRED